MNNGTVSILERLAHTGPGLEIWWDSSPLVYENWALKLLKEAPPERQADIAEQLRRLYDPENPKASLFRGVTTNPPLSLAAMQDNPAYWQEWIRQYAQAHPHAEVETVYWELYKEIVRRGAEAFYPIFQNSGFRFGHLSGQVDPRDAYNGEKMLAQALELAAIAPNVMIKVPGSTEGVEVLRELTSRGIPTNTTLAFVVPQFKVVAEAVQTGLLEARARGVDLTQWRSVVTQMSTRWENGSQFEEQAQAAGVDLTVELRRWGSIAIFKEAHRLFHHRAYPSKMLICSLRTGPVVDGEMRVWHLEHTAGANAVFTLPPSYISELFLKAEHINFESRIWEEVPAPVMAELNKIPYFVKGYQEDGWRVDEFNQLQPLQNTYHEFCGATQKMVDFVRQSMPQAMAAA